MHQYEKLNTIIFIYFMAKLVTKCELITDRKGKWTISDFSRFLYFLILINLSEKFESPCYCIQTGV